MADIVSTNAAIVPAVAETGYTITLNRYGADGKPRPLTVRIPENADLDLMRKQPLLLAALLKDSDPIWMNYEPGFVLEAVLYAQTLGLDIIQKDIYPIEGRLAVSDKAKIRYARSQGGYRHEVAMEPGEAITLPWRTAKESGNYVGTNLRATVRIYSKEFGDVPLNVYSTTLKAWFKGSNPNWRDRPDEMLRLRCIAKAYEEVCPVGTEPDEAPPIPIVLQNSPKG